MKKSRIGIVYHYYAHYRLPICQKLMTSDDNEYVLISDRVSNKGIKTIPADLARTPNNPNGINWLFVNNYWFLKGRFLWQRGLLSTLRKQNFDAVIFLGNVYFLSTWIAILLLKLKKRKIYMWTHGVTSSKKDLKWKMRKLFYNLSDALFLYGHRAKEVMIENGFPEHKLHVIYNSLDYNKQKALRAQIDEQEIARLRERLFVNPQLPLLIFTGRLTPQKKLNMIIEAALSLKKMGKEVNLLFVGSGQEQDYLEILTERLGLGSNVYFYGACYDEKELMRLVGSADICVSPGEVGLTALTALGYGTPVISHDAFNHQMPEFEAIIPGVNGDLFTHNSVSDLTTKIAAWLDQSKKLSRSEIRKRCYKIVDELYNPINQFEIIESIVLK